MGDYNIVVKDIAQVIINSTWPFIGSCGVTLHLSFYKNGAHTRTRIEVLQ